MDMNGHVMTCHAIDCSYNSVERCCAPKIEVGAEHPMCDMYTTAAVEPMDRDPMVSKCMVSRCHFNAQMSCAAAGVTLQTHAGHADCATFRT
jgi:hypothetical protein